MLRLLNLLVLTLRNYVWTLFAKLFDAIFFYFHLLVGIFLLLSVFFENHLLNLILVVGTPHQKNRSESNYRRNISGK